MDLFDYMRQEQQQTESPLAARIRPVTLDQVVGQEHIIGKGRLLRRAIQADKLGSLIFYGPPGTGKTTLARVIANTTSAEFIQLNATTSGKKDMEEAVRGAKDRLGMYGKKTILFIDEIHRFNKSQQDYLLPFVEDGTVTLIGATTENPYFEVNGALISRSTVFELKPLSRADVRALIMRAVYDSEKGMGMYNAAIDEDAADFLADVADGDARRALSAVELGGVKPNPRSGLVYEGIELARKEKVDFLLAIGGGSVIDTAKTIAMGVPYDGDFWDFFSGKVPEVSLPVGVVLTLAASGSEGSPDAIITNEKTLEKTAAEADCIRPKFSIMDPVLTESLPAFQTACGVTDIISHAFERYFTPTKNVETTDRMLEGIVLAMMHEGRRVMEDPHNQHHVGRHGRTQRHHGRRPQAGLEQPPPGARALRGV